MTLYTGANNASSTLASGIDDSVTSLDVATGDGSKFPSTYPFPITVDNEIMLCTNRSTDTLTVIRAQEGTAAASHSAGAIVQNRITAGYFSEIANEFGNYLQNITGEPISDLSDVTITSVGSNEILVYETDHWENQTLSEAGIFETANLCNASEVNTGTSTTKAITPDALAGSTHGTKTVQIAVTAPDGDVATGDGKAYFVVPPTLNGMNLVDADASVLTASTSGTLTVQIRNVTDSVDMLSTAITIDANEKTSYTAATAPVINTSNDDVATGDQIAIDVDAAGTGAKGLNVVLSFRLP